MEEETGKGIKDTTAWALLAPAHASLSGMHRLLPTGYLRLLRVSVATKRDQRAAVLKLFRIRTHLKNSSILPATQASVGIMVIGQQIVYRA